MLIFGVEVPTNSTKIGKPRNLLIPQCIQNYGRLIPCKVLNVWFSIHFATFLSI